MPAGRLRDDDPRRQALVAFAESGMGTFIATPDQGLLVANLDLAEATTMAAFGDAAPDADAVQAMSCVGPPTCRLAVTASDER